MAKRKIDKDTRLRVMSDVSVQAPGIISNDEPSSEPREITLKKTGLTNEKLFLTVVEGLNAVKIVYSPEGEEIERIPNHEVRSKYANLAAEILAQKMTSGGSGNINIVNIGLADQLKTARERFSGLREALEISEISKDISGDY